jgi:hypothetical protein
MTLETIFFTQLASIFTFVVMLFGLYRLLVSTKEAEIALLKSQISVLKDQLVDVQKKSPDLLIHKLEDRINIVTRELKRLDDDQYADKELIATKQDELTRVQAALSDIHQRIERAQGIFGPLFCPHCKSFLVDHKYESFGAEGFDVVVESQLFECGLEIVDDNEIISCSNKSSTRKNCIPD